MKLFGGLVRTTDGRAWSVVYEAFSWDDAHAIADIFGVDQVGLMVTEVHEDGREYEPVRHFALWTFDDGRIVKASGGE